MKVHIIANPAAGGGKGATLAETLHRELERRSVPVQLSFTKRAGDGTPLAQQSDADCFVSVGGDGTMNEILNGMDLNRSTLTILRAGTANVVSRELKLRANCGALADLIATRTARRIDVGVVNGRRFLLGIGAGLDAAVVRRVAEQTTGLRGLRRWIAPSIKGVLNFNHAPIRIKVNGEVVTRDATYAIVGNCRYSAGVFPTTPRATTTDGKLDLCAMHKLSIAKLATIAIAVWSPGFTKRSDIVYRQGDEIILEPAGDLPVALQVDGDAAGFLPARCTVLPQALEVIAPVC